MDEARQRKEAEARRVKEEDAREEARLRKEREELDAQFKEEEHGKRKKVDEVREANAAALVSKKG